MHAALLDPVAAPIENVRVAAFRIPTEAPESDGTLRWDATTLVVVEISGEGTTGLGYTYADAGVARVIEDSLGDVVRGREAVESPALWTEMFARLRNAGRQGASALAVSALDIALWDLRARCLRVPLVRLLGGARAELPVYGSGGFTSSSDAQLRAQFTGWAERGVTRFKMKIGRDRSRDPERVATARRTIGAEAELFIDANSAYARREALELGARLAEESDVRWFEQPLAPEDFAGLRWLRERLPAKMEVADGEYGYDLDYFRRVLAAEAVDVAMADLTRCGGITGFLKIAALCEAAAIPLSSHCAPALHVHPGCAVAPLRHAEYFHDHARIEAMLFDGVPELSGGKLRPDLTRPGHGLEFKWADAERFAV
ncbi:MAG TPA: enolase C-terminal domain-like protein [Opitutaceae bacterium]|nr:enolase C-terminal domain-like protein [Opitutaceae bacterium]